MLWEWMQRPHVARWFAPWMPATFDESVALWTSMVEGTVPQRGYLMVIDGTPIGYIEGNTVDADPDWAREIGLGRNAVAADVFIADPERTGKGLGPEVVGRFYLRMMDETGLDIGIIDPEVNNVRAIRAYEKAGFTFLRIIDTGKPHGRDQIMQATRDDITRALVS